MPLQMMAQQQIPKMANQVVNQPANQLNSNAPPAQAHLQLAWIRANRPRFDAMSAPDKSKMLGNIIYPLVNNLLKDPELTSKVTGMLIDLEVLEPDEIIAIIEDKNDLKERVSEAIQLINEEGMGS